MKTKRLAVSHPQAITTAQEVIQKGGIAAFPTDTVYGIGASAFKNQAIQKLYQVKERSREKAIPILVGKMEDAVNLTQGLSDPVRRLMEAFWPGPLTLVLPGRADLPLPLSPDRTIGLRLPAHPFTEALLRATGPLATTSANISGEDSAQTADEVWKQLQDRIELILDGGKTPGEQPSTVIDCTRETPKILRPGPISHDQILSVWRD